MSSIKAEFNSMLPAKKSLAEELAQDDKFLMVYILASLSPNLGHVCDQLLSSPIVPTINEIYS